MIPARPGYVAVFGRTNPDTHEFVLQHQLEVHAWDDDGCPMVLSDELRGQRQHRGLVRADTFSGFDGVEYGTYPEIVRLIPAGGWRVRWHEDDDTEWSEPLAGWGVTTTGMVVALATDQDGDAMPIDRPGYRIYHPDTERPATDDEL